MVIPLQRPLLGRCSGPSFEPPPRPTVSLCLLCLEWVSTRTSAKASASGHVYLLICRLSYKSPGPKIIKTIPPLAGFPGFHLNSKVFGKRLQDELMWLVGFMFDASLLAQDITFWVMFESLERCALLPAYDLLLIILGDSEPKVGWHDILQLTSSRRLIFRIPIRLPTQTSDGFPSASGWEKKALTKETWFLLVRVWTLQRKQLLPRPGLLSKNFYSRPVADRILTKEFWGWGWGSKSDPQLFVLWRCPSGPNRVMQPRCAMRFEIAHHQIASDAKKNFLTSDPKTP